MSKKTKKTEPAKIGRAGTLREAVAKLNAAGVRASLALLRAARHEGCPGINDHHRVDCDIVREWLEDPENAAVKDSPEIRRARAQAREAELRVERMEFRNAAEKESHIPRAELTEKFLRLASEQKSLLQLKLEHEYPVLLEGKTLDERYAIGRDLVDQICDMMQGLIKAIKPIP